MQESNFEKFTWRQSEVEPLTCLLLAQDRLPPVRAEADHRGNGWFLRIAIGFAGGFFLNEGPSNMGRS